MPTLIRWAVRCDAVKSTTGEPCGQWAIRGGYKCAWHGGSSPQARAKAALRLELHEWQLVTGRNVSAALRELADSPPSREDVLAELARDREHALAAGISLRSRQDKTWAQKQADRRAAEDAAEEAAARERDQRRS